MSEDVVTIATNSSCTDDMKQYLAELSGNDIGSDINKSFFGSGYIPSGNATYLTHQTNEKFDSVLIYKDRQINKKAYTDVVYTSVSDMKILDAMIVKLLHDNQSNGIFTGPILNDDQPEIQSWKNHGFKVSNEVLGMPILALMRKCHENPNLRSVRYRKNNMALFQRLFMELLTEHDTLLAQHANKTYGRPVYPENLKTNNAYRIKISHFTKYMAFNASWHSFLLFDDKEAIGFVKGKVEKSTKVCFPDLYLRPEYFEKYANAAYAVLLKSLYKSYVRYIGTTSIPTYREYEIIVRLFGRALGTNLFKIT